MCKSKVVEKYPPIIKIAVPLFLFCHVFGFYARPDAPRDVCKLGFPVFARAVKTNFNQASKSNSESEFRPICESIFEFGTREEIDMGESGILGVRLR